MINISRKLEIITEPFITVEDVRELLAISGERLSYNSARIAVQKFKRYCQKNNIKYTSPLAYGRQQLIITRVFLEYVGIDKDELMKSAKVLNAINTSKDGLKNK